MVREAARYALVFGACLALGCSSDGGASSSSGGGDTGTGGDTGSGGSAATSGGSGGSGGAGGDLGLACEAALAPADALPHGLPVVVHPPGGTMFSAAYMQQWINQHAPVEGSPLPAPLRTLTVSADAAPNETTFTTIQAALDAAEPGDKVLVKAGLYPERVMFPKSGEAGKPIVLEGERSASGEWLSIIDPSEPLTGWQLATDADFEGAGGHGIYKRPMPEGWTNLDTLTVDGKRVFRIRDDLMSLPWPPVMPEAYNPVVPVGIFGLGSASALGNTGHGGLSYFLLAQEAGLRVLGQPSFGENLPFWEAVGAIHGVRDGVIYLCFADGRDPLAEDVRAAPKSSQSSVLQIYHRQNVVVRNLAIRGSTNGIRMSGTSSKNIIEHNRITLSPRKISVQDGPKDNVIRYNELTAGFYQSPVFGPWSEAMEDTPTNLASRLRGLLYYGFKYVDGSGTSNDNGVKLSNTGVGNKLYGNYLYEGLIGITGTLYPETEIWGNVIHSMSSVGFYSSEWKSNTKVHDNLVYDSAISFRFGDRFNDCAGYPEQYNVDCTPGPANSLYVYNNAFVQSGKAGTAAHLFALTTAGIPDTTPETEPNFYVYHNVFLGGGDGLRLGIAGPPIVHMWNTQVLNNIVVLTGNGDAVRSPRSPNETDYKQLFDHNWTGDGKKQNELPGWYGEHNLNHPQDKRVPDLVELAQKGVDVSKPFTIGDRTFNALPGMPEAYPCDGAPPNIGLLNSEDAEAVWAVWRALYPD